MKHRFAFLAVATLAAGACQDATRTTGPESSATAPRNEPTGLMVGNLIPDQYIIVFNDDVIDAPGLSRRLARERGGSIKHTYTRAVKGFAARMPAVAAAALRNHPNVAYVEQDQVIQLTTTQTNATWGLDRVDQRALPLNGTYVYTPDGSGVNAYIIDTGILFGHTQFGGRAVSGYDAVDGGAADDCNGHGTHVAGTVGGSTYGVAKAVRLYGVRVLDCAGSGSNSGVIAGMDWVANNHVKPAVANMSLGGGASTATDDAVRRMHNAGVTVVVAAGNSNVSACGSSPARAAEAITVGSTTSTDARSSFSNYGSCLDIFAPGSSITSAWHTSTTATNTISGTSMASPHVAGVAALYLQGNPAAAPTAVASAITSTSTTGVVTSAGTGSPNRLVYSPLTGSGGGGGGGGGAPCTGCTAYTGSLSGAGDSDYHPNGTYYYSAVSGSHLGYLRGPAGTDFDLYLQKWNGNAWVTVARAEGTTSSEDIVYSGTAGYYTWRVLSYSGAGSYTFYLTKP